MPLAAGTSTVLFAIRLSALVSLCGLSGCVLVPHTSTNVRQPDLIRTSFQQEAGALSVPALPELPEANLPGLPPPGPAQPAISPPPDDPSPPSPRPRRRPQDVPWWGIFFSQPPRYGLFSQLFLDRDAAEDTAPEEVDEAVPYLWDDPLLDADIPEEEKDAFFLPWGSNVVFERNADLGPDETRGRRDRLQKRSRVDVRSPGPDTANFPNSAFTLPKGRFYIESSPFTYYGKSFFSSPQYNWEFLYRYGVTDNLEFRLFSNGYTVTMNPQITGFAPLAFDFKVHLWDENLRLFLPAAGMEVYIQTNFGTHAFNNGTQPSLALEFDQTLPCGIELEYNFGINGTQDAQDQTFYVFSFQWAL